MGPMTIRKLLPFSQKFDPGFISLLKKQVLVRSCIITILIICSLPGVTAWSSPVLTDSLPEPLVISRINNQIKFENYLKNMTDLEGLSYLLRTVIFMSQGCFFQILSEASRYWDNAADPYQG